MTTEIPRDFHFTDHDFQRIRKLIYDHAGIALSDAKRDLVYSRLARRLRANSINIFSQYLSFLAGNTQEWEAFVNSLTTNLTSFFRENHHFPLLAEHIKRVMHRKPLQLWCAAASTGEEAYSMAMTMVDLFGSFKPPVHIFATDIDTNVLRKAESGIYGEDRIEKLPAETIDRFFRRDNGGNEKVVTVRQELRDMITFRQLNLLDNSWSAQGPFEAIFCRNVMIYFDKPTQYSILKKFIPAMRQDSLLFAGHSESFYHAGDLFKLRGKTVYEIANASRHLAQPGK
ncbi:MAG TPA: CheR family methyltransferase [Novimethylophilus sp.]|jgi:chemotaxis protein methyltransferase CheR|uniref:CheR family methyltransferase n=1 Tax=Novimethylophilus sp. TaxID=2137426 RepID=UPI002F401432